MKKVLMILAISGSLLACGGNDNNNGSDTTDMENMDNATSADEAASAEALEYDPHRGEGKFKDVQLDATINEDLASKGKAVYEVKCASCHKLSDERLVGPGWKGVTERRKPEWIMNFSTNPDAMLDKDPELQAQLEICLVRMPNQGISDDDARNLVEFMRKNDSGK